MAGAAVAIVARLRGVPGALAEHWTRPVPFPLASPGLATRVSVTSGTARSDRARGKFTQPDREKRV